MLTVYTVTIGRNIGYEPMDDSAWRNYRADVSETFEWAMGTLENFEGITPADTFIERHSGTGEWDGYTEESYKVALLTPVPLYPETVAQIRAELRQYCKTYRQDAIAFSIGFSELVTNNSD